VHTKHTLPAVGKNYLLEEDRLEAIRVYLDFLKYGNVEAVCRRNPRRHSL